jgi:hypothetical protein
VRTSARVCIYIVQNAKDESFHVAIKTIFGNVPLIRCVLTPIRAHCKQERKILYNAIIL